MAWYLNHFVTMFLRFGFACMCSVASDAEILWTATHQAPLFMAFPRQEYQSGLTCPPPWDLPNSEIEPVSLASPLLQVDSLSLSHWGRPPKI